MSTIAIATESKDKIPGGPEIPAASLLNPDQDRLLPIYTAFDIEKKGAKFEHPIIQIGVAFGRDIDHIERRSFCFDYKSAPFEQRCFDEFWVKLPDILKRIETEAVDPKIQWPAFGKFLDELEAQGRVEIVTDNAAYDIEAIDYHLDAELKRAGVRYTSTMEYRSVHDPSEQITGLPSHYRKAIKKIVKERAPHTHWAADDAEGILTQFFLVKSVIQTLREAENKIATLLAL